MGLFSKDKQTPEEKMQTELQALLIANEEVVFSKRAFIDYAAITTKRVVFVNKNWKKPKTQVSSIPFSKISSVHLIKGTGFLNVSKEVILMAGSKDHEVVFLDEKDALEFHNKIVERII